MKTNTFSSPVLLSRKSPGFVFRTFTLFCALIFSSTSIAQSGNWVPITGAEKLRIYISGLSAERTLAGGEVSRGEYKDDGTGVLFAWGASFPKTWQIKGDDQICISSEAESRCYQFEGNISDAQLYRAREVTTGKLTEFRVSNLSLPETQFAVVARL